MVREPVAASPDDPTESVTRESFMLAVDNVRNDSIVLRIAPTPDSAPALRWSFSNPPDAVAALVHPRLLWAEDVEFFSTRSPLKYRSNLRLLSAWGS